MIAPDVLPERSCHKKREDVHHSPLYIIVTKGKRAKRAPGGGAALDGIISGAPRTPVRGESGSVWKKNART